MKTHRDLDGAMTFTDKIGVSLFIMAKAFIVLAVAYKCLIINVI